MERGRPSKLTDDVMRFSEKYIEKCSEDGKMPSIEGLAYELKVRRQTLYNWAEKNDDFEVIMSQIMNYQAQDLINGGLSGKYNSTITKLILTKHGYTDRQDITTKGKEMPTPILGGASRDEDADKNM